MYKTTLLPLVLAGCLMPGLSIALADEPEQEDPGPLTEAQADDVAIAQEQADQEEESTEQEPASDVELRRQVAELERQLNEARNEIVERNAEEAQEPGELTPEEQIEQTVLPENPTRQDCEAYVNQLRELTAGRRSFSSGDPVVAKLRAVPIENIDLVLTEISGRSPLRYYANYAMREVDPADLREQFVATLEENPANIGVIVMHGWVEDVRPIILQRIETADGELTPAWFQAAVELNEPNTFGKLHEITISSRYAVQYINMLQMLPEYDLAHTVNVCWNRAGDDRIPVHQANLAQIAARFGQVEALGILIGQLSQTTNYMASSSSHNARRTNILRLIDFRGSNSEIQAWFEENQEQLVFDYLHQRFVLPQAF